MPALDSRACRSQAQCRELGTSQAPPHSRLNGRPTHRALECKLTQREEPVGGGTGAAQVDNCQDLGRGAGQGHGGGAVARHQDGGQVRLHQVGGHAGVCHIGHKLAQLGLLEDLQGPGMQGSHPGCPCGNCGRAMPAKRGNGSSQGTLSGTPWGQHAEVQDIAECKAAAEQSQQDDMTTCPGDSQSGRG